MGRLPYNLNTLNSIRFLTSQGKDVAAIAGIIEWTPDEIKRAADKHGIEIIPDLSARLSQALAAPPAPEKPAAKARLKGAHLRIVGRKTPRNVYASVAISADAESKINKLAKERGVVRTAIMGLSLDYLIRNDLLADIFDKAFAEAEAEVAKS